MRGLNTSKLEETCTVFFGGVVVWVDEGEVWIFGVIGGGGGCVGLV